MNVNVFIMNLFLTIFIYMSIPIIFILIGKKYTLKALFNISIINFIIGFIIIYSLAGITRPSGGSALWTYVGYWLMKKKIMAPNISDDSDFKTQSMPEGSSPISIKKAIPVFVVMIVSGIILYLITFFIS